MINLESLALSFMISVLIKPELQGTAPGFFKLVQNVWQTKEA